MSTKKSENISNLYLESKCSSIPCSDATRVGNASETGFVDESEAWIFAWKRVNLQPVTDFLGIFVELEVLEKREVTESKLKFRIHTNSHRQCNVLSNLLSTFQCESYGCFQIRFSFP